MSFRRTIYPSRILIELIGRQQGVAEVMWGGPTGASHPREDITRSSSKHSVVSPREGVGYPHPKHCQTLDLLGS
jgi:hypothetical protein